MRDLRRVRWEDMVETYKITTGQYDIVVAPTLVEAEICVTRGYDYRLQLQVINY